MESGNVSRLGMRHPCLFYDLLTNSTVDEIVLDYGLNRSSFSGE